MKLPAAKRTGYRAALLPEPVEGLKNDSLPPQGREILRDRPTRQSHEVLDLWSNKKTRSKIERGLSRICESC